MATTPDAQAKKSVPKKIIDLPSGAKAEILPFKGKHVREASRIANGDENQFLFAIIVVASLIDGKKLVIEDLDELDGMDLIKLMSEFNGLF